MALTKRHNYFPFDLFEFCDLPGQLGSDIRMLARYSMFPPFPWGQWLYARLIEENINQIEGEFIDLGVGMGGMSLFLGLRAREHQRKMYCLDSFTGLPALHPELDNPVFREGDYGPPDGRDMTQWKDRLERRTRDFGLEEVVEVVPGFFDETLRRLPPQAKFAFVHVDCDLYTSVRPVLDALYDRVSDGGFIVIDDFFHPAQGPLRAAVSFFNARRITSLFHVSFPYTVVIKKGEKADTENTLASFDGNIYSLDYLRSDRIFIETLEKCWRRANESADGREPARNAGLLLSLLRDHDSAKKSDIYGYWYALRDFWNGFQDSRYDRPVYTI
ncbi:TylF/MycF/NovP-related O-methyltransferase [Bradyrhizobium sp. SZCCHNRI20481]|uniref:TylF/MycF/NovP-related O-methyltransferase n=1 Tax=Bradyrhizobium sp. SZCCHNRI20481 TaxID=3057286 RepID=UPI002916E2A7|nr:TylF/MycF/NovP-related O-methyltransferase [Bradyrhizobium sp. SZCCHNRI20481]